MESERKPSGIIKDTGYQSSDVQIQIQIQPNFQIQIWEKCLNPDFDLPAIAGYTCSTVF